MSMRMQAAVVAIKAIARGKEAKRISNREDSIAKKATAAISIRMKNAN